MDILSLTHEIYRTITFLQKINTGLCEDGPEESFVAHQFTIHCMDYINMTKNYDIPDWFSANIFVEFVFSYWRRGPREG